MKLRRYVNSGHDFAGLEVDWRASGRHGAVGPILEGPPLGPLWGSGREPPVCLGPAAIRLQWHCPSTHLDQTLEDADEHHVVVASLGRDGQEHVEEGAGCYGRAEHLVGRISGRQEAARDLGDDVAPEEGGVDHADGLGRPVELGLGLPSWLAW